MILVSSGLRVLLAYQILTQARVTPKERRLYEQYPLPVYDTINLGQDRALMWKVDLWLIPWLCLLYLLSFLDRTNIGNARLAGMETDLSMAGHDYNNSLTIFFVRTEPSFSCHWLTQSRSAMPLLSRSPMSC